MKLYPNHKHYIAGFLSASILFSTGLYMFREGISRIPPVIRVTTNLSFEGCKDSKSVAWILVTEGPEAGEFYRRCIGE